MRLSTQLHKTTPNSMLKIEPVRERMRPINREKKSLFKRVHRVKNLQNTCAFRVAFTVQGLSHHVGAEHQNYVP